MLNKTKKNILKLLELLFITGLTVVVNIVVTEGNYFILIQKNRICFLHNLLLIKQ